MLLLPSFHLKSSFRAVVAALAGFASVLRAADTTWSAGTGNWFTAANWNTNAVPTAADRVFISNGGTAQVQAAGALAFIMRVGDDTGGAGTLEISNGGSVTSDQAVVGTVGGSATATVTGAGSTWTIQAIGGVLLSIGSTDRTGTVNVLNGASVIPDMLRIGSGSALGNGTLVVDGSGSSVLL